MLELIKSTAPSAPAPVNTGPVHPHNHPCMRVGSPLISTHFVARFLVALSSTAAPRKQDEQARAAENKTRVGCELDGGTVDYCA